MSRHISCDNHCSQTGARIAKKERNKAKWNIKLFLCEFVAVKNITVYDEYDDDDERSSSPWWA